MRSLIIPALLVVVTLAAFADVRNYAFVLYDDTQYVSENPHIRQGLAGLRWALTSTHASNWHPLTWWSHILDYQLFGLDPHGHHLTNLVLHTANTVLLFLALVAMTNSPWRSAFVAALFGVHPLHVESVAQVAERKDVLSGTFWMLTMWAYARYARRPGWMAYLSVCLCLALGLMAKSMLVTLPCVLLLLDWWPLRRIPRTVTLQRAIVEKLPLLALAGMAGAFTFVAQSRAGLVVPLAARPLGERLANAVTSYVTYAAKTFWPMTLSCFYPYPESFAVGPVVGATAVLVAVSALAISLVRSRPYVATGWFWYLGTLVPVIGIVGIGGQSMADHYTYLPLIGLFVVVSWSAWDLFERVPHREIVLGGAAVLAIGLCVAKTRVEAAYWRDSRSLFEHALAVTSRNFLAHGNLGLVLRQEGRSAEAMAQFSAALAVAPEYVEARNHLGLTQRDLGEPAKAVASFEEVLRRAPDFAPAHFNLGETLLTMGDDRRAIEEFSTTVRLAPDHVGAHLQLSRLLLQRGQAEEAVSHARQALALGPASPQALGYLADALAVSGNLDEAVTYYREALRMQPDDVDATYNLGNALARRGQMDEAIATYRRAITLAPDHAEAHNNLGRALMSQGRTEEAVSHYSEALRLAPSMAVAFYNRGMANQQLGKAESAADDLARARALDPNLR